MNGGPTTKGMQSASSIVSGNVKKEFGAFKDRPDPSKMPYEVYHRKLYSKFLFYKMRKDNEMVNKLLPLFMRTKFNEPEEYGRTIDGYKHEAKPFYQLNKEQQEFVKSLFSSDLTPQQSQPSKPVTAAHDQAPTEKPPGLYEKQAYAELERRINGISQKLNDLQKFVEGEFGRKTDALANLKNRQLDIQEEMQNVRGIVRPLASFKEELDNVRKYIKTMDNENASLKKELSNLKEKLTSLEKSVAAPASGVEALKIQVANFEAEVKSLKNKNSEFARQLGEKDVEITSLKKESEDTKTAEELAERITELEKEMQSLKHGNLIKRGEMSPQLLYGVPLKRPASGMVLRDIIIGRIIELKKAYQDIRYAQLSEILATEFPHNNEVTPFRKRYLHDLLFKSVYPKHPELRKFIPQKQKSKMSEFTKRAVAKLIELKEVDRNTPLEQLYGAIRKEFPEKEFKPSTVGWILSEYVYPKRPDLRCGEARYLNSKASTFI